MEDCSNKIAVHPSVNHPHLRYVGFNMPESTHIANPDKDFVHTLEGTLKKMDPRVFETLSKGAWIEGAGLIDKSIISQVAKKRAEVYMGLKKGFRTLEEHQKLSSKARRPTPMHNQMILGQILS